MVKIVEIKRDVFGFTYQGGPLVRNSLLAHGKRLISRRSDTFQSSNDVSFDNLCWEMA